MKNVLVVIQNVDTHNIVMVKTYDYEKQKYIWSLPNMKFHWNPLLPKKSGKQAAEHMFKTFSFGLCNEEFLKENKKFSLPSGNIAYLITVKNCDKIPAVFDSLKSNKSFKLDITNINLQNYEFCFDVKAFTETHHDTIECLQFIYLKPN